MEKLIKYLLTNIVTAPEGITITTENKNSIDFYKIRVNSNDMARVIGKKGRIIKALRQIVRIKAQLSQQKAVLVLEE